MRNQKIFEVLLSISWFAMDFCWFKDYLLASLILGGFGILLILVEQFLSGPLKAMSQHTNTGWFLMNVNWLFFDKSQNDLFLYVAYFFFLTTAISIIFYLYQTIKEHRELENPLKRIK
jgi:hypothetical protein